MTTFGIVWFVIMVLVFAICGWLCVFKTNTLVTMGRKNFEKSKFVRLSPFSNMVLKPSYPIYIRCAGVFVWLWAIAILYAVFFLDFR